MKTQLKIALLFFTCLMFMGCPAGHYQKYDSIQAAEEDSFGLERIALDKKTEVLVNTGYWYRYGMKRGHSLTTYIRVRNGFNGNVIKNVKSSILGELARKDREYLLNGKFDTISERYYELELEGHNLKRTLKKIRNDTITITFNNGKKLQFASTAK